MTPRPALLVCACALLAGCGDGDGDDAEPNRVVAPAGAATASTRAAEPTPTAQVRRLRPERLAGSLVVVRFAGTRLPGYVRDALRERRAAGVILFRDNVVDAGQVRRLTAAVRRASDGRAIVAADQEGGDVRIFGWLPPELSAPRQAAAGSVGSSSLAAGRALRRIGVNVALAPVADAATVTGSAMRGRVYGSHPDAVARAVTAAVAGFRDGGVAPTVKHFPGLGGSTRNTDWSAATVGEQPSVAPWRAAIAADVPFVMASHARYPRLDRRRIASQSRRIMTGLLRSELGFQGATMTDSMEAAAVRATCSLECAAERSMRAGVDLLLTTGRGSYIRIRRHLARRAREDAALRERMEQALARVGRVLAAERAR